MLRRLQLFVALAEQPNITKIAQALRVSQPALSRQMKLLQEEIDVILFRRNGRGLELTPDGKTFFKKVESITAQIEELKKKPSGELAAVRSKHLTIVGTHAPCAILLPAVIAKYKQRHPEAQIDLRADIIARIEEMILEGEAELAVTTSRPFSQRIACESYMTQELVLIVSARHPIARKRFTTVADLETVPLIIRGGNGLVSTTETLLKKLGASGHTFKIALRCDSPDAIRTSVRRGMGVGIMYRDQVKSGVKAGEFKILRIPGLKLEGTMYIVRHRRRPLSANAEEVISLLREEHRKTAGMSQNEVEARIHVAEEINQPAMRSGR